RKCLRLNGLQRPIFESVQAVKNEWVADGQSEVRTEEMRLCGANTKNSSTLFTECQLLFDFLFERTRPKSFVCRTKKYSAASGRSIFSSVRTDRRGRRTPSSRSRDSWRPSRFRTSS